MRTLALSFTSNARSLLAASAGLGIALTAVLRAATAIPPEERPDTTAAAMRAAFSEIAAEEPAMRASSAQEFPGDLWSQDDDFHGREQKRAREVAGAKGMRLPDVLRALDDGLREHWPITADGGVTLDVHLAPGVPPCRPRLSY